jgi:hypothetical protein
LTGGGLNGKLTEILAKNIRVSMCESILFRATLPAYLNNETGMKMALMDTLKRRGKPFIDKNDLDGSKTTFSRAESDLIQISVSLTNIKINLTDVCKALCPILKGIAVSDTLEIKTYSGCREEMMREEMWQNMPKDDVQRYIDECEVLLT